MKKKLYVALLAAFLPLCAAFAADGVMSGEKNIKVVRTEWFDIIYTPGSAASAALLAEHADSIYRDVCGSLGTEVWARFPVVITPAQDEFNAYFTSAYYNHIVLYDTPETESMAVFSDTLLSTFRHELTHAVTYNMKNKFWRTVGSIFGDLIDPGWLIMTGSHAEGAAVTSESMNGEGRLNDPYSAQMVRQAKLEGRFPGYADIYGAHDRYPVNQYYYFGSAFDGWLQKTYGMEKYAAFWYECVNARTIHQSLAFSSVYGITVKNAWKAFENSISVPAAAADPLSGEGVADYFSGTKTRSPENGRGSLYTSLSAGSAGFAYCDDYSSSFWFSQWDAETGRYKKSRKLFTVAGMDRAVLSADGTCAAVSFTGTGRAVPKTEVKVYSLRSRSWFLLEQTGLRNAAVITDGGSLYLAAVKTKSQNEALYVYALTQNAARTRITGARLAAQIPFPTGSTAFSLSDGGDGTVVYVYKKGLAWSVRSYSIADGTTVEYPAPVERMVIRSVSYAGTVNGEKTYTFSWAGPGTMPRFGRLSVGRGSGARMELQASDVSGGVYEPVVLKTGRIAYAGQFFTDNRLMTAAPETPAGALLTEYAAAGALVSGGMPSAADSGVRSDEGTEPEGYPQLRTARAYNTLSYYRRGVLLPFSDNATYSYSDGTFSKVPLPFGATYISSDPWSSGIVEFSAGYNPLTNSGAVKAYVKSGTATSLFSWALFDQAEFDRFGYKQTMNSLQFSSAVPAGTVSYFTFGSTVQLFEGRQSLSEIPGDLSGGTEHGAYDPVSLFGCMESGGTAALFAGLNKCSAGYTNIHRTGPGTYEQGGFSAAASYTASYVSETGEAASWDHFYQNVSADIIIKSPRLLPYICAEGYTYNFPFKIESSLFYSESTFLKNTGTVVLYAGEVQKAVPFFTLLYVSRWRFTAVYTGSFKYAGGSWDFMHTPELIRQLWSGDMAYYDAAGLGASVTMIPNYGGLAASSASFSFGAELDYRIRRTETQNPFVFSLSINAAY